MTRLLISAAFAGLLALGGAVCAQDRDDHPDRGRSQQSAPPAAQPAPRTGVQNGRGYNPGAAPQNAPAARPAPPPTRNAGPDNNDRRGPNPGNTMRGPDNNDRRAFGNDQRGPNPGNTMRGPNNNDRRAFSNDQRGPDNNDRRAFSNDRRGPGQRSDFSAFQRNFNAPRRFRAQVYERPLGWYAHRWTYGEFLPSLFWAPDFWLDDYFDYGLAPPPPGTVWVRDGDDALLIDRFSGEIIQVEYSVFY